jgi:hypothetical protein
LGSAGLIAGRLSATKRCARLGKGELGTSFLPSISSTTTTTTEETERKFKDWPPKELAQEVNSQLVKQAVKYVYGVDDSEQGFLNKLTSSDHPQTHLGKLRDRRKQKYAASWCEQPLLREAVGVRNDRHFSAQRGES